MDMTVRHPLELPAELWHRIVEHVVGSSDGVIQEGRLTLRKRGISALLGLATTSKLLRVIVLEHWARDINLLHHEDSNYLGEIGRSYAANLLHSVRRAVCVDSYMIYQAPSNTFEAFTFLEELVLDGHSDINFSSPAGHPTSWGAATPIDTSEDLTGAMLSGSEMTYNTANLQLEPTPLRMSYRKLKVKLPQKLRTLRIYNSHVPDVQFIHKVARECPELRSLTLSRCTIFTRTNCGFWQRLPRSESDSYFSNQGVETYAVAVGKELSKIPKLQEIQIGIYLTPHEAINEHLEHHTDLNGREKGSETWASPCNKCALEYQQVTERSEKAATSALADLVPTLSKVSWLSFFSEGCVGWHTYDVRSCK
ncbi:hypothetical protein FRC09_007001 [Ceratobasidium sp. 395]|nr:hypothetical protein FRC09_007001 [Ceratobasidium sp. 395]